MHYTGSCHCGKVAFEVEGDLKQVIDCNCSICEKKGALLWFVPRAQLKMLTPDENLKRYTFGKGAINHCFCPACGIHPLGEGAAPDGTLMAAINVRCLDGVDLAALSVQKYDGRAI